MTEGREEGAETGGREEGAETCAGKKRQLQRKGKRGIDRGQEERGC